LIGDEKIPLVLPSDVAGDAFRDELGLRGEGVSLPKARRQGEERFGVDNRDSV
jgi:hypothetical protein